MESKPQTLGGRLDLIRPHDLSADQRKFYEQLQNKTVPWANESGFRAVNEAGELIGPFNAMLRSTDIAKALMNVEGTERMHTALSEKARQVVILTVGAAWQADYELYAHIAVARKAGLSEEAIQALAKGQTPTDLSDEEMLAYNVVQQLLKTHKLEADLYQQAIETFGEKGVFDMLVLAGQYMTISAILNTFAVPAPEGQ